MSNRAVIHVIAWSVFCTTLSACAWDEKHDPSPLTAEDLRPAPAFSIGGTVTGTTGPIALQNSNGTVVIVPADGKFAFQTPMARGALYRVTVVVPPNSANCVVTRGTGTVVGANISDIRVACAPVTYMFSKR